MAGGTCSPPRYGAVVPGAVAPIAGEVAIGAGVPAAPAATGLATVIGVGLVAATGDVPASVPRSGRLHAARRGTKSRARIGRFRRTNVIDAPVGDGFLSAGLAVGKTVPLIDPACAEWEHDTGMAQVRFPARP